MKSFKVGQAPWESDGEVEAPTGGGISGFRVGQAPWEKQSAPPKESGVLSSVMDMVGKIDAVTGAPTRAAISAAQDGQNPFSAFADQFGADPATAPSGKDIAQNAGISSKNQDEILPQEFYSIDEAMKDPFATTAYSMAESARKVSPAGVAGQVVDLAADPTLLLPSKPVAAGIRNMGRVVTAVGSKSARAGGELASRAGDVVSRIPGVRPTVATASAVSGGVKNTASALKKMFTPTVADDFAEMSEIARKNGIDPSILPESIEFGENSFISRAARNRAEGVLGQDHLQRFQDAYDAVQDAAERQISRISGGSVPSPVEAGELIRRGFDQGVDRFFETVGMTHNKVMEAIPGLTLAPESLAKIDSKLAGIEKWAKGRQLRGFTDAQRAQADQVLRAINAVRAGSGSYKQTVEALRDIGEVAFKAQNIMADVPPDVSKFRDLYSTLDDALIDTVEKAAGAPVAKELRDSNRAISEFLGDKSVISSVIGNRNMSPERVFSALVEQGDTKKIQALKSILPPETFQQLKGAFLASQIRRNADEAFSFRTLHNSLRNKKHLLGELLSPDEISEFGDVVRLGSRFGSPVLSTSGTGASSLFSDLAKGARSAVETDAVIGHMKESARARSAARSSPSQQLVPPQNHAPGASAGSKPGSAPITDGEWERAVRIVSMTPAASRTATSSTRNEDSRTGPNRWARDGFDKLQKHTKSGIGPSREDALRDPALRRMLIRASDLAPGSRAMDRIVEEIRARAKKGRG